MIQKINYQFFQSLIKVRPIIKINKNKEHTMGFWGLKIKGKHINWLDLKDIFKRL